MLFSLSVDRWQNFLLSTGLESFFLSKDDDKEKKFTNKEIHSLSVGERQKKKQNLHRQENVTLSC